jgi:hypothetical protein
LFGLEGFLEFLAAKSEADVEDVALAAEIGHDRDLRVTGHVVDGTGSGRPTPICHTVQHDDPRGTFEAPASYYGRRARVKDLP